MRYITKLSPPGDYLQWVFNYTKSNRRSPDYTNIPPIFKEKLRILFITEQKGLCCYCCGRISFENSHIEHFYPRYLSKVHNRKQQTNYSNMFASCNGYIQWDNDGEFCGHRKKHWYDEHNIISPLENDCGSYFIFSSQGIIKAKDNNEKANAMIKNLGLDEYALNEARKKALEAIGYFEDDFDNEIARKIVTQEDEDGYLPSFCNIIIFFVYDRVG